MKKVYFISGLGADKRVFSKLDLSFCDPVFIDWIDFNSNESLPEYALRLRKQIPDAEPTIVGISFGGMLVTEMAKAEKNIKAIIISSTKTTKEFPSLLRVGKYLPLYKWMPSTIAKWFMQRGKWILGGKNGEEKKLLSLIISDTDMRFARWAMQSILVWKNEEIPFNLIHIHGTGDRLFPSSKVAANHFIQGGTHVMTLDKAEEISNLLKSLVSQHSQ